VACLGLALYGWHLSEQIEKRFSGRRWSIPSKVFSDTTILYPGQSINRTSLMAKLEGLGYRKVSHKPLRKGESRISDTTLDLYLNDFEGPYRNRPGFPVRIDIKESSITAISHLETGQPIPILELEPEELMLFFGLEREQRRLVSVDQVPQHVIYAVLAAEDSRFFDHHGLDPRGIVRALYTNLRYGRIRQGGSTITQQLAKNVFLTPERTFSRKFKELLMALTMEVMYDKKEILEIYLNEIYLGQKASISINGFGEASHFYFGKPVSELSLAEAAALGGLIRAPNLYSPYIDRERCEERKDLVLQTMYRHGWIAQEQLRTALDQRVIPAGFESYTRKAPYFMDYLSQQLSALYPAEALTHLGLSIYTTLDTQVERAAEMALQRALRRLERGDPLLRRAQPEKKLQGALIVMQPKTGYILAMVGGRDYSTSQFNRATQALRQPGSAFKPFVFLSGLDEYTPASMLSNEERSYAVDGTVWRPQNYVPVPEPRITMRNALAKSVNLATVDLAMKVGLDRVISTASAFRFSTPLRSYPSLSLGSSEVIPLDLARAYCAFAADGVLPLPLSLKEVVSDKHDVIERRHMTVERVTSPAKAFIMTSMLRSVAEEGTARSLKNMGISFPVAGKTGTTNGFKDAWFVGYTPDILALIWVGFDNGESLHKSGALAALPIWADLMKAIPQYISGNWFAIPPGVESKWICSESGQLAIPGRCPKPVDEFFLSGNAPTESCPIHRTWGILEHLIEEVRDLIENL
jgi:penicillin-binding protein 1B